MRPLRLSILCALLIGATGLVAWLVHDAPVHGDPSTAPPVPDAASAKEAGGPARIAAPPLAPVPDSLLPARVDEPGRSLLVTVTDTERRSLADARLRFWAAGRSIELGATDADGILSTHLASGIHGDLQCTKDGFATEWLPVDALLPPGIVIEMRAAVAIHGRVVDPFGRSPGADVNVLAWPAGRPLPDAHTVELAREGRVDASRAVLVATDSSGEFTVPGIDPRLGYRLSAGGRGQASAAGGALAPVVKPGDEPVELTIHPLYVVALDTVGPASEPLPVFAESAVAPQFNYSSQVPYHQVHGQVTEAAFLAGASPVLAESKADRVILLFSADERGPTFGPVNIDLAVIGYAPLNAECQATPIDKPLQPQLLRLVPLASMSGALRLRAVTRDDRGSRPLGFFPAGHVYLSTPLGESHLVKLEEVIGEEAVVERLPVGDYDLVFKARGAAFRWPEDSAAPCVVPIAADRTSIVDIDFTATGWIEVEVEASNGVSDCQRVFVSVGPDRVIETDQGPAIIDMRVFPLTGRPFRIGAVPPGRHAVRLREPVPLGPALQWIEVGAGRGTVVRFPVAR